MLPFRCRSCKHVISTDRITKSLDQEGYHGQAVSLLCPHCCSRVEHTHQYAHGDPRNIALIGHWDGWQPFSTSLKHSCGMNSASLNLTVTLSYIGSFEVQVATMTKLETETRSMKYMLVVLCQAMLCPIKHLGH